MPGRVAVGESWDAIVIGSGMGGLAAASLLAQLRGKRVLVLERHFKLGGFTHTFERKGFSWDVGLHYVGQTGEGSALRQLLDLVTLGRAVWNPMPEGFERFSFPGLEFTQRAGASRFRDDLAALFPAERRAIDRYLAEVKSASRWFGLRSAAEVVPAPFGGALRLLARLRSRLPLETTGAYLARRFHSPELRAVVAAQWGDYGLPPGRSAFAVHALIVDHYLGGGAYPAGGAGVIAEGAAEAVRAAGGELRVDHEVREILVEGGRAAGVRAVHRAGRREEELVFRARLVVSDAGAAATFLRLLPEGTVPGAGRDLARLGGGYANVTLYLGLARSPAELGFRGENHWLYDGLDHDAIAARADGLAAGRASAAYVSFPSLKDPSAKAHTAEIIAPMTAAPFARWRGERWKRRGEAYEATKERISLALLDFVEARRPGLGDLVAYRELSTPLTTEHFTGHAGGAIYGVPAVPERYRLAWLGTRTPVAGLFLAGSDASAHGIGGALFGGVLAAAASMGGRGFPEIMAAAKRRSGRAAARPASSAGA